MLYFNNITIDEDQLEFVFSRSSGPGGQNVNKVNTKVTLLFDIANCPQLDPRQKEIIRRKLKTRINSDGVLRVTSQQSRSQTANKNITIQTMQKLLEDALKKPKPRKKTKPSKSQIQKRLDNKKQRSQTKQLRTKVQLD